MSLSYSSALELHMSRTNLHGPMVQVIEVRLDRANGYAYLADTDLSDIIF